MSSFHKAANTHIMQVCKSGELHLTGDDLFIYRSENHSIKSILPPGKNTGDTVKFKLLGKEKYKVKIINEMTGEKIKLTSCHRKVKLTWDGNLWVRDKHHPADPKGPEYTNSQLIAGLGNLLSHLNSNVKISSNGNVLAIGVPDKVIEPGITGGVYVYTFVNGTWTLQQALVGSGSADTYNVDYQGASVALSADGNTLAFGGPAYYQALGAVWIFSYNGSSWVQTNMITPADLIHRSFGSCVSLSADASVLAVGAPGGAAFTPPGVTYIYYNSGGQYVPYAGNPLSGTMNVDENSNQGWAVSLSADGNRLAVGSFYNNSAWIFDNINGTWIQYGNGPLPNNSSGTFGFSVLLSNDGNTLAVGSPTYYEANGDQTGCTTIFTYDSTTGTWIDQQKLIGRPFVYSGNLNGVYQGRCMAMTSDASILMIGGTGNDNGIGAVWAFSLGSNGKYANDGTTYFNDTQIHNGTSVSISGDGSILVIESESASGGQETVTIYY